MLPSACFPNPGSINGWGSNRHTKSNRTPDLSMSLQSTVGIVAFASKCRILVKVAEPGSQTVSMAPDSRSIARAAPKLAFSKISGHQLTLGRYCNSKIVPCLPRLRSDGT